MLRSVTETGHPNRALHTYSYTREGLTVNIRELIEQQRRGRSNAQIAAATGGALVAGGIQRLATQGLDRGLNAESVVGLSRALDVSEDLVWRAVGETIGVNVRTDDDVVKPGMLYTGWQHLTTERIRVLRAVSEILVVNQHLEEENERLRRRLAQG